MKIHKSIIYAIVKQISYETLLEEFLQYRSDATNRLVQKFSKNSKRIKLKLLSNKIFNSIILIIQPIFLLFTYISLDQTITGDRHFQIILFAKAINLEFFFVLQFFNFLLLGIFNLSSIMSGRNFDWINTLPLSRKELKKLFFYSIYHNLNLPIITNMVTFPIIMLLATQNFLVLLVSIGVSILNSIFTLSILIILGEKIVKFMIKHKSKSRKPLFTQLINSFSYVIIIFGGIYIIEIVMNLIVSFILNLPQLNYSPFYNMILFLIPFPSNVSYFILIFTNIPSMHIIFWLNLIYGLGLYLITIYFLLRRSFKSVGTVFSQKFNLSGYGSEEKDEFTINVKSHYKAFIRKDLLIASRDIQTSMSFIMPLIMSITFTFFFNFSLMSGNIPLTNILFIDNWLVILGFAPIISAIIVNSILTIDELGRTVMDTLPIIRREQARSKLTIILLIQILSVLSPTVIYLFHDRFFDFFLAFLSAVPIVLIYSIVTYLLRIRYFGRKKYYYTLNEVWPENKVGKWTLIFTVNYLFYIIIFEISYFLFLVFGFFIFLVSEIILSIVIILFLKSRFDKYFPMDSKRKWSLGIAIFLLYCYVLFNIFLFSTIISFPIGIISLSALIILSGCILIVKFLIKQRNKNKIIMRKQRSPKMMRISDKKINKSVIFLSLAVLFFIGSLIPRFGNFLPFAHLLMGAFLIQLGILIFYIAFKIKGRN